MPKFRKKPVEIEAVQWTGQPAQDWPEWMHIYENDGWFIGIMPNGTLEIPTLEGLRTASINDWIIQGVAGEVYPYKPDIFKATYETVSDDKSTPTLTESDLKVIKKENYVLIYLNQDMLHIETGTYKPKSVLLLPRDQAESVAKMMVTVAGPTDPKGLCHYYGADKNHD